MKRYRMILLTLALLLSVTACGTKDTGNKNTISVVTKETTYDENGELFKVITYTYNDRGLLLSKEQEDPVDKEIWNDELGVYEYEYSPCDGIVDKAYLYSYDEHNNLISCRINEYSNNDSHEYSYSYVYNEDDTVASYTMTYDGRSESPVAFSYTDDGALQQAGDCKCTYDSEGRLATVYVPSGDVALTSTFTYTQQGDLESVIVDSGEGATLTDRKFTFDENGNVLTETTTFRGSFTYVYSNGKLTAINGSDETSYTFNSNGQLIESTKYGMRTVYTREDLTVSTEDAKWSARTWTKRHDIPALADCYNDIIYYFLPNIHSAV